MRLTETLRQQLATVSGDACGQALFHCQVSKEFEEVGDFEAAQEAMGDLWSGVGNYPRVAHLPEGGKAEVLLRAGTLSGWIGSTQQIKGAQEFAKDLISESAALFEKLQNHEKAAEALVELAFCYWREGALDEARVMLRDVLERSGEGDLKALALLRSAIIESTATRYHDALHILMEAAPLFEASLKQTLKGRFHNELAVVLEILGTSEKNEAYLDRALVEYTAASYHFEQAGHTQYCALVENNLGFLFSTVGRFAEAHAHLDRARELLVTLGSYGRAAQVDETRARTLLAEARYSEAAHISRTAVEALEKGGEQSLLAEALRTHGTALARLGEVVEAQLALEHALEVAQQAGDLEGAGQAALKLIEELDQQFDADYLRSIYEQADDLLARSQHPGILMRLRACARKVFASQPTPRPAENLPSNHFVYAAEQTASLLRDAHAVAKAQGAILLTGETGTGKESLARLIHRWSECKGNFVALNCAALTDAPPDVLFESQLFGCRQENLNDDLVNHLGAAREADEGTLFLDEIGELSLQNQGKLLRLVERGEVYARGAFIPDKINVRIIAANQADLKDLVATGRFRQDLYYRIATFQLRMPPLRERPEDIPVLAAHFIKEQTKLQHKEVSFTPEAIAAMQLLSLGGNARELRSLIEQTIRTAPAGTLITAEAVEIVALRQPSQVNFADAWAGFSLKKEVHRLEQRFIELALKDAHGKITQAARLLGFKHHESLSSLLKTRFQNLLPARTPAAKRYRSIIREVKC